MNVSLFLAAILDLTQKYYNLANENSFNRFLAINNISLSTKIIFLG